MRVAIDARFLTHPQRGGFKTYTENLVAALSDLGGDVEYILYLDREPGPGTRLPQKNCTCRVVSGTHLPMRVPLREQVALPRQIERDRPDLVHFLCNTAPVNLSRAYIITLHDIIQVTDPEPLRWSLGWSDQKRWAMSAYSRWAIRRSLPRAARIITVSNYERLRIEELFGLPSAAVSVTHPAPGAVFRPLSPETRRERRQVLPAA
jgi:hypothetical protein